MKQGQPSRTAELVATGRALAHGNTDVARFSDPTALPLLSEDARDLVARMRANTQPANWRERTARAYLARQSQFMIARTVAIDDAVRESGTTQLVILGAGFDGRAWRMPELRNVDVFEVDHPSSQAVKRERAATLPKAARTITFVPVDFTRDSLDAALESAGHDSVAPTTWIWEGVVMYLTEDEIAATLEAIAKRSAPGSRLIVNYHAPAFMLRIVGLFVRRIGEPFRAHFKPPQMAALLDRFGFTLLHDIGIPEIGQTLSPTAAKATRAMRHMRIAVAERR